MQIYVIIAPPNSSLSDEHVSKKFTDWVSIIPDHSWAISTKLSTCADIRDTLRMDDSTASCVVVKATEYNGYAERGALGKAGILGAHKWLMSAADQAPVGLGNPTGNRVGVQEMEDVVTI